MLTQTEENYLKTIYLLGKQGKGKVSLTALASALGNNPASVIDMLKKLTEKKLIQYERVKGARLTGEGIKTAIRTVRKHRLWELFLQIKLGYTWDEVHEIAEQLEHVHHEDLDNRLEKFLGFPQFDPHGDPIPDKKGHFPELKSCPLSEYHQQEKGSVVGLTELSSPFLKYLDKVGIQIGSEIKVLENYDFDKSLNIKVNGKKNIHLSHQAAQNILIGKV